MFIDSHCHLDLLGSNKKILCIINRAHNAGVRIIVSINTCINKFNIVHNIALFNENVYCTIGTHPCNASDEINISLKDIIKYAKYKKVIGIGETGLDYFYNKSSKILQKIVFRNHIEAARQTNLPLIIHSRNADKDMINILKEEMLYKEFKILLHCFNSSLELCYVGLDLGAIISFSGIITFKNVENIHKIVKLVPIDRILIETDAPYLSPVPFRGKINEPSYVIYVAETLAKIKKININQVHKIIKSTFFNLFLKVPYIKYKNLD